MLSSHVVFSIAVQHGRTYEQFMDIMHHNALLAENPPNDLSYEAQTHLLHVPINVTRTKRIHKTYTVGENLCSILCSLHTPQTWVIITEDWCGDSAQNLPYIVMMAQVCPDNIRLLILQRDTYPDVIDSYLTNGTRSIPIMIGFHVSGEQIFRWGPRPAEAQAVMLTKKSEGVQREEMIEAVHKWYNTNRGKALESEMIEMLRPFSS
jgi:hypothetical protein